MAREEQLKLLRKINLRKFLEDTVGTRFNGGNTARCPHPDHEDRHPSFAVYKDRKDSTWHWCCYSCCNGKCGEPDARGHKIFGNDIFALIQWMSDYEGSPHVYTFPEAVNIAAEYLGIEINDNPESAAYYTRIRKNLAIAKGCNFALLRGSGAAYAYLRGRGLDDEDMKEFMLGTDGSKILYPIADANGNVRGFSWRVVSQEACPAKYVNSKNDNVFQKRKLLYGMDKLDPSAKEIYITEGQMDVIAAHKYGLKNVVASMGVAFTYDHLEALKKCCPDIDTLVFVFDGDTAGQTALKRSAELARENGYFAKCVLLKDNVDLFDLAMSLKEGFVNEIEKMTCPYFYEQFKDEVAMYDTMILNFESDVMDKFSNVTKKMKNERERGMLTKFLAERFNMRIVEKGEYDIDYEEDYYQSS